MVVHCEAVLAIGSSNSPMELAVLFMSDPDDWITMERTQLSMKCGASKLIWPEHCVGGGRSDSERRLR